MNLFNLYRASELAQSHMSDNAINHAIQHIANMNAEHVEHMEWSADETGVKLSIQSGDVVMYYRGQGHADLTEAWKTLQKQVS